MAGWALEDIPWNDFSPDRASAALLPLVKAASLVEANAADYRDYLCNVFSGDDRACSQFRNWAVEEEQHGAALAQWASRVDPAFNFKEAVDRFRDGFRIPVESDSSVRGSLSGEMLARCMVETGTNSFYTALANATDEPALKFICNKIADDEMAHFWLFHSHMRRHLDEEDLSFNQRLRIALSRIAETEDDELAYAWYAANNSGEPYNRRHHGGAYHSRALTYYTPSVVKGAVKMIFDALGVNRWRIVGPVIAGFAWGLLKFHRFRSWLGAAWYDFSRNRSRTAEKSSTATS